MKLLAAFAAALFVSVVTLGTGVMMAIGPVWTADITTLQPADVRVGSTAPPPRRRARGRKGRRR